MPALAERSTYRTLDTPKPPELGRIIPLHDTFWQKNHEQEWKSPLAYKEGDTPLVKGAKERLGELGLLQRSARQFEVVTPDNFMLLLGITTRRAEKKPENSWHTGDAAEIIFPEEETQIREQIRELIFLKRESEGIDTAVMRFVEINDDLQSVSNVRRYKLEITSLITAHLNVNNRELFELNIVLPEGVNKEDIFSLWDEGQRITFGNEEILLLPSLESAPQFQYGIKTLESLISKAFSFETYLNTEQALEALHLLIQRNEKGNIRPGKIEYEIIDGHFCTHDWRGRMIPVFLLFDDAKACKEFLEFEQKVVNGPDGNYKFQPSGQALSAATSNIDPDKLKEPVVNDFDKNGNKVKVNTNAKVGAFYTPPTIDPPRILPEPVPLVRPPLFLDPFFTRNILPRTEFDRLFPTFPGHADQSRTAATVLSSAQPENNFALVAGPLFLFPLAGVAVQQRALESIVASAIIEETASGFVAGSLMAEAVSVRNFGIEQPAMLPINISPELVIDLGQQKTSVPRIKNEVSTFNPLPPNPKNPGGGGKALSVEQQENLNAKSQTMQKAESLSEKKEAETTSVQHVQAENKLGEGKQTLSTHREVMEEENIRQGTQNTNTTATGNKTEAEITEQTSKVEEATLKEISDYAGNSGEKLMRATTQVEIENTSQTAGKNNIFRPNQTTNVKAPTIIFPQIQELNIIQFQIPSGQIIQIPQMFLDQQQWLSLWQQQAQLEGDLKEVWQKVGDFMGPYQQTVYTVGLIFVILLKLLNGGIVLI